MKEHLIGRGAASVGLAAQEEVEEWQFVVDVEFEDLLDAVVEARLVGDDVGAVAVRHLALVADAQPRLLIGCGAEEDFAFDHVDGGQVLDDQQFRTSALVRERVDHLELFNSIQ